MQGPEPTPAKQLRDLLLQVLGDGRLADRQSHVVDFKNTIILMTSDIGSDLLSHAGKQLEVARDAILRKHFRLAPGHLSRRHPAPRC